MKLLVSKRWGIDLLTKYAIFFALINFVVGFGFLFLSGLMLFNYKYGLEILLGPLFLLSGIVLVRFGYLITKNSKSK